MRSKIFCLTLALSLSALAWLASPAQAAWTRIEWEDNANSPLSFNGVNHDGDFTANLSMNHVVNFTNDEMGWIFSNGNAHSVDSGWGSPGAQTHLNFAGTGVRLRALRYDGGNDTIAWRIESALGQVVKSGTLNLMGAPESLDVTLAESGELPLGLYRLVIDPGFGEVGPAILDYAEVADNALTRVEAEGYFVQTSGTWGADLNFAPSGGSMAWSNTPGDTITLNFNGTGVAVVNPFSDTGFGTGLGTFEWSIDGQSTTTLDLAKTHFPGWADQRVSTILANGLAAGPHTLVCKITSTGKPVLFDAFDIIAPSGNPMPFYEAEDTNSPLQADGIHHASDYVAHLSTDHKSDLQMADLGVDYSNGHALAIADSWPLPGMAAEFAFAGAAIGVNMLQYGNGESEVNWKLLGAGNEVVKSGTFNLNSGTLARPMLTVEAPAPGLYKLQLSAGKATEGQLTVVDYFTVSGDTLSRIEENDARVKYGVETDWIQDDVFGGPSAGKQVVSSLPGATLSVDFIGTDIAVVTPFNPAMGSFTWSIDNGAGGSGTINEALSRFAPDAFTDNRVSTILAKGLADERHTLTITIAENNTANVYIDAFDTNGSFAAYVPPNGVSQRQWSLYN